jgi:hypothetical protein
VRAGQLEAMAPIRTRSWLPVALALLAGALPFGATYGLCLVAGLRETERLSPADERAARNALFLTLSYVGFGVPYAFAGLDQLIGVQAALLLFGAIALVTALRASQAGRLPASDAPSESPRSPWPRSFPQPRPHARSR